MAASPDSLEPCQMPQIDFHRNQIFYRLPESLCENLFDAGETLSFSAGSIVLNEGDRLRCLYIVLKGQTEALLPKTESRLSAVRLNELGPGDCFGEYAFIDQRPASATIRALTDAEVFCIGYDELRAFLDEHPTVASIIYQNLLHILVRRLRESNAELDLFTLSFSEDVPAISLSLAGAAHHVHNPHDVPDDRPSATEELLGQFFQAIENCDMSQLPLGDQVTYSGTMLPDGAEGADAVRTYMSETAPFIKSFRIEEAVMESRSAAVLVRYKGTNTVSFEGCYFMDFENDQIIRIRTVFDSRPLMQGGVGN
jgi:CRP-like cAMP-binding protein